MLNFSMSLTDSVRSTRSDSKSPISASSCRSVIMPKEAQRNGAWDRSSFRLKFRLAVKQSGSSSNAMVASISEFGMEVVREVF